MRKMPIIQDDSRRESGIGYRFTSDAKSLHMENSGRYNTANVLEKQQR